MTSNQSEKEYIHQDIEKKWQDYWLKNRIFVPDLEDFSKPKKYILPMFPYPSGSGLHVGHVRNYTIADAAARFYRMNGFNVLTAIGWDAFGLPSEQYAIQTNNHPSLFNNINIKKFRQQLKSLGFSYDWSREINTSEPNYYRWTQWIFKQIYLQKLANYLKVPVFWCEKLATVLSHEEIKNIDGKLFSERGSFPVVRREISQWVLSITKYAGSLSNDLENLDWPISIKNLQRNWIGLTKGTTIKFKLDEESEESSIDVFTTRADTIFAVNSIAISPFHQILKKIVTSSNLENVINFCRRWKNINNQFGKTNQQLEGKFTGSYCLNPVTMKKVPIWVTNFVFDHYGTGALMIAPFSQDVLTSNDITFFLSKKEKKQNYQIDYCFSLQYNLPIKSFVTITDNGEVKYGENSFLKLFDNKETAIKKVTDYLISKNLGFASESYHLQDWVFSRQRYWGEPIPVVHLADNSTRVITDSELPLKLPELFDFSPSSEYYSPLQKLPQWIVTKYDNLIVKRDVNVMPQWAGSCWYYIAFLLYADNNYLALNSSKARTILDYWLPVDLYVGGQEHANLHLLYARFWHKVLQKINIVKQEEPFQKLFCQGMILGENGEKMSKSRGNVIAPDYCVEKWGADALRLYEAFLAPGEQTSKFSLNGVSAMKKWLNRVYVFFTNYGNFVDDESINGELSALFSSLVKEVTIYYQKLKLNLVVAKLMEFINKCYLSVSIPSFYAKEFIKLLNPLAPHITEELWSRFTNESLTFSKWPVSTKEELNKKVNIVVQINGKKKAILEIFNSENNKLLELAMKNSRVKSSLFGKKISKIIKVENKLINIVTDTAINDDNNNF